MNRRFLLLAGLALLGGCASVPAPAAAPADAPFEELEPLIAARAGGEALTITVTSNGCTSKADFSVFVERKGRAVQVAFGRRKLDVCRAAPRPLELTFTWAELGLAAPQPVFLLNPLEGR
jgi:hypothetical protein